VTHLRLWRFDVPSEKEARFVAAYKSDGDWVRLFATDPGFIRTDLWREADGTYVTADHWESAAAYERFQAGSGDAYRQLDAELEDIAGVETFLGAFELIP
jgi:heme-degrading monooxygenase HmoA